MYVIIRFPLFIVTTFKTLKIVQGTWNQYKIYVYTYCKLILLSF